MDAGHCGILPPFTVAWVAARRQQDVATFDVVFFCCFLQQTIISYITNEIANSDAWVATPARPQVPARGPTVQLTLFRTFQKAPYTSKPFWTHDLSLAHGPAAPLLAREGIRKSVFPPGRAAGAAARWHLNMLSRLRNQINECPNHHQP